MHSCLETARETADIVLIQEPRVGSWDMEQGSYMMVGHGSFKCILPPGHNNNQLKPRVATFVTTSFPNLRVTIRPDIFDDPYLQTLEVSAPGVPTFYVYHIYNEQYGGEGQWTLQRLLQNHALPTTRCLVIGDMNAHHPWWNSKRKADSNGDMLATKMEEGNFYLVNEPDAPTYFQFRLAEDTLYESVLDLAFATGDLYDWISNWAICAGDTEATGSDHKMCRFEILHDGTATVPSPTAPRYNWKKAD
ncbi:DNase I-like protein [Ascobolus immersus RN42]|uniref:DNase I-like protein n=1 Tax=Ascobolus immersus RN42 TaxID=1160509 RepID=A0A3N4I872_ASCIM|nr:DNase I-like protein [Ascobolus immersus RN42]